MGQITFEFDSPAADCAVDRHGAFEIGWDFAHYALTPPSEHMLPGSPLRQGWDAARASFGTRTLAPTRHTRKWLQLRLNASRRGRAFESLQVTPNYLRQIDVDRCPITREVLTQATGTPSDASIDRVRNDAGYAAGNLVVMSTRANAAKGDADFDGALAQMRQAEATALPKDAGRVDAEPTLANRSSNEPDTLLRRRVGARGSTVLVRHPVAACTGCGTADARAATEPAPPVQSGASPPGTRHAPVRQAWVERTHRARCRTPAGQEPAA